MDPLRRDTLLATMLNNADNETVCRVGPDTPMGRLMREYWVPALLSRELPEAGQRSSARAPTG